MARRKPREWDMDNPYDLGWVFITLLAHAAALVGRVKR